MKKRLTRIRSLGACASERGVRSWLIAACTLLPLAAAGAAQAQWSVQAGMGYSSGLLGAELTWRPSAAAVSLGAGGGGIGARLMVEAPARGGAGEPQRTRYVGAGYLLRPWNLGGRSARGVAALEVGTRILHPTVPVFADLAAGGAVLHGPADGVSAVGPVLRLQLGVAFHGRGTGKPIDPRKALRFLANDRAGPAPESMVWPRALAAPP